MKFSEFLNESTETTIIIDMNNFNDPDEVYDLIDDNGDLHYESDFDTKADLLYLTFKNKQDAEKAKNILKMK